VTWNPRPSLITGKGHKPFEAHAPQRLSPWLRPAAPACVQVVSGVIISTPVAYTTANGTYSALGGSPGLNCPPGQAGDIVGLRLNPGSPPNFTVAWCGSSLGRGRPAIIATSPDGNSTVTVWVLGEHGRGGAGMKTSGTLLFFGKLHDLEVLS
jgi:hypothetical protein